MKKVFALFVLFIALFVFAVGMVVREQGLQKAKKQTILENSSQSSSFAIGTDNEENKASSSSSAIPGLSDSSLSLSIESPQNNVTVTSSTVLVKGKTEPFALIVINEYELKADSQGNFSKSMTIDEGENYISIIAYNDNGDTAEKEIMIIRE